MKQRFPGYRAFLKRTGHAAWNGVRHNFGLKLVSLIFAVVLWSYVLATTNPMRSKTISGIPVQLAGQETLASRELSLTEDPQDDLRVRVVVQTNNDRLRSINENNVTVTADLSEIGREGAYRLTFSAITQYGTVKKIIPSYVDVNVEKSVTRLLPVTAAVPAAPEGTHATEPVLYPQHVLVTGAESVVESVAEARITLGEEDVQEHVLRTLPVRIIDSEGKELQDLTPDAKSVSLSMQYIPTARVPIRQVGEITAADGYEIKNVQLLRAYATVWAASDAIDAIEAVETEPVTAADLTEDTTLDVPLILPAQAQGMEPETVRIKVQVEEERTTATLRNVAVTAVNAAGEPVSGAQVQTVSVTVNGSRSDVQELEAQDIRLTADVSGMTKSGEAPLAWKWNGAAAIPSGLQISVPQTVWVNLYN